MSKPIPFRIRPAIARGPLLLLLVALAISPTGCRKKTPAATAVRETQLGAQGTNQTLAGEVHPYLTGELRAFAQDKGRLPTNFLELARTRLDLVPRTPPDMTWAIDYTTQEVKLVPR
jgi:hypothetical protein